MSMIQSMPFDTLPQTLSTSASLSGNPSSIEAQNKKTNQVATHQFKGPYRGISQGNNNTSHSSNPKEHDSKANNFFVPLLNRVNSLNSSTIQIAISPTGAHDPLIFVEIPYDSSENRADMNRDAKSDEQKAEAHLRQGIEHIQQYRFNDGCQDLINAFSLHEELFGSICYHVQCCFREDQLAAVLLKCFLRTNPTNPYLWILDRMCCNQNNDKTLKLIENASAPCKDTIIGKLLHQLKIYLLIEKQMEIQLEKFVKSQEIL